MSVTVTGNGGIIEVKSSGSVVIEGGTRIDVNQNIYNTNVYGDTPSIEIKGGSQNNIIDKNNQIDIFKCGNFLAPDSTLFYETFAAFPDIGETNKLYVDKSNGAIYIYEAGVYKIYTPPAPFDEFKTMLTTRFLTPTDTEFTSGQVKNLVIQINEVGGLATSSNIVFRVTKSAGFTISFDPSLVFADTPKTLVDNAVLNIAFQNFSFYTQFTITDILPALGSFKIGFTITCTGNSGSIGNLNTTLINGTGGSVKINSDTTRLYIV